MSWLYSRALVEATGAFCMRNNIENEDGLELFGRLLVVLAIVGLVAMLAVAIWGIWAWIK